MNRLPRDVWPDGCVRDGHHGDWRVSGQPERLVVAAGVVADVVGIAEQEWHRVEALDARAGKTWMREKKVQFGCAEKS